MTLYIIRTRSKPYKYWAARGMATPRKDAYRFTGKEVGAIVRQYPAGWFKTRVVVIPVEVS